jgi:hypothetical protein
VKLDSVMNIMINTVFVMVAALALSIGIFTTIHSQQAFALTGTHNGINGGICTTNDCNANGVSGKGGSGGNAGSGMNGKNGGNDST